MVRLRREIPENILAIVEIPLDGADCLFLQWSIEGFVSRKVLLTRDGWDYPQDVVVEVCELFPNLRRRIQSVRNFICSER